MMHRPARRLRAIAGGIILAAAMAGGGGIVALHHRDTPARPVVGGVPIAVLPASANGTAGPGPGYFTVTAVPGQMVRLHALILNPTRRRALLTLVPVDANRAAGGLAYALPGATPRGVGAWMRLSTGALRLDPTSRRLIGISLRVPPATAAGTYTGAISIGLPQYSVVGRAEASIHVQVRLAVAVVVHVRAGSPG